MIKVLKYQDSHLHIGLKFDKILYTIGSLVSLRQSYQSYSFPLKAQGGFCGYFRAIN